MQGQYHGVHGRDPSLNSIENLLQNQRITYHEIFLKKPDFDTPTYHYDWWLFPINIGKGKWSDTTKYYAIDREKTEILLVNEAFKQIYVHCLELYLNAQKMKWNGYDIRFSKVILSLLQFLEVSKDYENSIFTFDKTMSFHQKLKIFTQDVEQIFLANQFEENGYVDKAYKKLQHYLKHGKQASEKSSREIKSFPSSKGTKIKK